jgi:regulator of cell morphogenesis and NO signaling
VEINNRKITELVGENYVYASVLYYFGIKFYDYSEKTLGQVCSEKGLNLEHVVASLEMVNKKGEEHDLSLFAFPIDLVIEYLKHSHYIFIKQKLPYIARLVESLGTQNKEYSNIITDLKFVFPLFVEDFIHHIYEEEDTLFTYISLLNRALNNKQFNPAVLYYQMEKHSIQNFAVEHEVHDDVMKGMRNITGGYKIPEGSGLLLKVVYSELQAFEEALMTHAKIENEILFPKSLMLEKQVKKLLQDKVKLN